MTVMTIGTLKAAASQAGPKEQRKDGGWEPGRFSRKPSTEVEAAEQAPRRTDPEINETQHSQTHEN